MRLRHHFQASMYHHQLCLAQTLALCQGANGRSWDRPCMAHTLLGECWHTQLGTSSARGGLWMYILWEKYVDGEQG
ncbi:hypothetical protein L208DRAFT_1419328, partial [Tricholoma matsutake]